MSLNSAKIRVSAHVLLSVSCVPTANLISCTLEEYDTAEDHGKERRIDFGWSKCLRHRMAMRTHRHRTTETHLQPSSTPRRLLDSRRRPSIQQGDWWTQTKLWYRQQYKKADPVLPAVPASLGLAATAASLAGNLTGAGMVMIPFAFRMDRMERHLLASGVRSSGSL
ncbi:hypothetical protein MRX96_032702 [Rhipicephalus microplus]